MPVKTIPMIKFKTLDDAVMYMAESIAESESKMAKYGAITAKYEAITAKYKAIAAKATADRERSMREMSEEIKTLSRQVQIVSEGFGTISERFGKLVEFIVIPGIRPEMNALGHNFRYATANKKFKAMKGGQREYLAEIDLFLHNGVETMAVEVKTTLSTGDIDGHLIKLSKLRKYEAETGIKGKKLYGAIVGVFIGYHAHEYALKNGLYVLEILEQEQKLKIDKPAKCRVW